ncbi:MAG: hypothetical protein WCF93_01815 [Candidatus Moraniibacteriota bacterium]|jgi:hypothetical protein
MDSNIAIKVSGVSKTFRIPHEYEFMISVVIINIKIADSALFKAKKD